MAIDVQLAVYIDQTTKDRLDALRRDHGTNISHFIRLAIEARLEATEGALLQAAPIPREAKLSQS